MSDCRRVDLLGDRIESQVVACPFFFNEKPLRGPQALLDWRLNGLLSRMLARDEVCGEPGERVLFAGNGKIRAHWILFLGAGERDAFFPTPFENFLDELLRICCNAGFVKLGLCLETGVGYPVDLIEEQVRGKVLQRDLAGIDCLLSVTASEALG